MASIAPMSQPEVAYDCDEKYALHKAAWNNDLDRLEELCSSSNPDNHLKFINSFDNHGNTPLHIAVHFHHVDAVDLLVSKGAEVDRYSLGGWFPGDEAVASGARDLARLLLMVLGLNNVIC